MDSDTMILLSGGPRFNPGMHTKYALNTFIRTRSQPGNFMPNAPGPGYDNMRMVRHPPHMAIRQRILNTMNRGMGQESHMYAGGTMAPGPNFQGMPGQG